MEFILYKHAKDKKNRLTNKNSYVKYNIHRSCELAHGTTSFMMFTALLVPMSILLPDVSAAAVSTWVVMMNPLQKNVPTPFILVWYDVWLIVAPFVRKISIPFNLLLNGLKYCKVKWCQMIVLRIALDAFSYRVLGELSHLGATLQKKRRETLPLCLPYIGIYYLPNFGIFLYWHLFSSEFGIFLY